MSRSLNKELFIAYEEPERVLRSARNLFKTTSLDYLSSPIFDLFFDLEDQCEEEVAETMTEPNMEEYMTKTQEVLEIVDLFHIPEVTQDQIMLRVFPISLTGVANRWLRNEPVASIITRETLKKKFLSKYCPPAQTAKKMEEINNFQQEPDETLYQAWERFKELLLRCPQHYLTDMQDAADAKKSIQDMADHSQKWQNGTSTRTRRTDTSDGLAVIQAQLNNLGREIKKSISTTIEADMTSIRRIGTTRYTVSSPQNRMQFFKPSQSIIPFPNRLIDDNYYEEGLLEEWMLPQINSKESATNLKRLLKEKPNMGYQIEASMDVDDSAIS
ncbi:hypothetical protein Tco_0457703 [Tanacetum coccineum]